MGVFKNSDPELGSVDLFTRLFIGRFDPPQETTEPSEGIVLDPTILERVLSFADFVCRVWEDCGMENDGAVYLYALAAPKFLTDPRRS